MLNMKISSVGIWDFHEIWSSENFPLYGIYVDTQCPGILSIANGFGFVWF